MKCVYNYNLVELTIFCDTLCLVTGILSANFFYLVGIE